MADNHKRKEEKKKHFQDLPFSTTTSQDCFFFKSVTVSVATTSFTLTESGKRVSKKPNPKAYFPLSDFVLLFTKRAFYLFK